MKGAGLFHQGVESFVGGRCLEKPGSDLRQVSLVAGFPAGLSAAQFMDDVEGLDRTFPVFAENVAFKLGKLADAVGQGQEVDHFFHVGKGLIFQKGPVLPGLAQIGFQEAEAAEGLVNEFRQLLRGGRDLLAARPVQIDGGADLLNLVERRLDGVTPLGIVFKLIQIGLLGMLGAEHQSHDAGRISQRKTGGLVGRPGDRDVVLGDVERLDDTVSHVGIEFVMGGRLGHRLIRTHSSPVMGSSLVKCCPDFTLRVIHDLSEKCFRRLGSHGPKGQPFCPKSLDGGEASGACPGWPFWGLQAPSFHGSPETCLPDAP